MDTEKLTVDRSVYHGIVGEFLEMVEPHTEAHPMALLTSFLTAFGNCLGDKPYIKVESTKHPMRLFVCIVGDTSLSRKGTSWNHVSGLFNRVDETFNSRITTNLSSGEGLINAVRDPLQKNGEIIDEGASDKRLLVYLSEFSSLPKVGQRSGNILSSVIRDAWDSGTLTNLTKQNPQRATNAHISILGHITKDELNLCMPKIDWYSGYANRFLWVHVTRVKELPFGGHVNESDIEHVSQVLKETLEYAKYTNVISWTEKAMEMWKEEYSKLSKGRERLFGAATSRVHPYALRLASLYCILDKDTQIDECHLKAALSILKYADNSVRYILDTVTGDDLADRIVRILRRSETKFMTRSGISSELGHNYESREIDRAVKLLIEAGIVTVTQRETGGRPRTIIYLNKEYH